MRVRRRRSTSTSKRSPRWYVLRREVELQALPTVFGCSLQMFVFGEIQEPLTETVNLVENIIKSQLVELVRSHFVLMRRAG